MKKFLLSIAALTFVGSAFASEVVLAETDFSKLSEYPYWKSDRTTAEVKDGALVVTNAEAAKDFWDVQYMVADGFTLTGGTEYTVNVKIKDFSGTLHYNLGTWGSNVGVDKAVEESSDWQTVTIKITAKEDTDNTAHLLLQSGEFVGTYYVESVVISYEEEGGDTPDDPDTPSIDGKMVYEIDYAKTDWAFYVMGYAPEVKDGVLVSNQPDAINEQTGEVEKDENGNPKKAWYQYFIADQIPTVVGKNYVATVKIKTSTDASMALNMGWGWNEGQILNSTIKTTPEWQEISQTFENIGGEKSNLVLQPGMYDGTVEIAWVKVFEAENSGVKTIVPIQNNRTVVYNLMGVKVLDTDDASQLNTLRKGIYIVNGKKVAL